MATQRVGCAVAQGDKARSGTAVEGQGLGGTAAQGDSGSAIQGLGSGRGDSGSAAQRLGGTAARRPAARRHSGSAAQRLGGTAARRHSGSAAQRLGGTAAGGTAAGGTAARRTAARRDWLEATDGLRRSTESAMHAVNSLRVSVTNFEKNGLDQLRNIADHTALVKRCTKSTVTTAVYSMGYASEVAMQFVTAPDGTSLRDLVCKLFDNVVSHESMVQFMEKHPGMGACFEEESSGLITMKTTQEVYTYVDHCLRRASVLPQHCMLVRALLEHCGPGTFGSTQPLSYVLSSRQFQKNLAPCSDTAFSVAQRIGLIPKTEQLRQCASVFNSAWKHRPWSGCTRGLCAS